MSTPPLTTRSKMNNIRVALGFSLRRYYSGESTVWVRFWLRTSKFQAGGQAPVQRTITPNRAQSQAKRGKITKGSQPFAGIAIRATNHRPSRQAARMASNL